MSEQIHEDETALDSLIDADEVEMLFVQMAHSTSIDGDRIQLSGIGATTLMFSDRPARVTAHIPTGEFVESWDSGADSFAADPPNAVLSTFLGEEINEIVVVLQDPKLTEAGLSYQFELLDGDLPDADGPSSLFIDSIGRPMTATSVAGVHRRGRRRGRRRARRR